ncbi:hypothetical protein G4948_06540 [Blautia caecimuris]|nr:hypothetical protein [Blautia caecimuris]
MFIQEKTARRLGISRSTLWRILKKINLCNVLHTIRCGKSQKINTGLQNTFCHIKELQEGFLLRLIFLT